MNIAEELVKDYLEHVEECEFIQTNVQLNSQQGEIDVVGIKLSTKEIFICEVAAHINGLHYVKGNASNNEKKITEKFKRGIQYFENGFTNYTCRLMFWSPIVGSKAREELSKVLHNIEKLNHKIELVVNEDFHRKFQELRTIASTKTIDFKSPVMRLLQIEEWTKKRIAIDDKNKEKISRNETIGQTEVISKLSKENIQKLIGPSRSLVNVKKACAYEIEGKSDFGTPKVMATAMSVLRKIKSHFGVTAKEIAKVV